MIYLGDMHCEFKKNMCAALLGGSILEISIKLIWLMLLFNFSISFPIFCLLVLSVTEREMLTSLAIIVICLFFLSVLRVLTLNILKSCDLVHTYLGLGC